MKLPSPLSSTDAHMGPVAVMKAACTSLAIIFSKPSPAIKCTMEPGMADIMPSSEAIMRVGKALTGSLVLSDGQEAMKGEAMV